MSGELDEAVSSRCPICLHALNVPTSIKQCGHLFCNECIHKWASSRKQPRCPLCQAELTVLCTEDGREETVTPPETIAEEGPDLSCLDHAYFKLESERLLRRATAAQMDVTRAAYGSGRRGSAAADDASSALQQVIGALQEYRHDMEQEVPFDPEAVLSELYSLDSIVQSVQAGRYDSAAQQQGWQARDARLLSADDAAHEWHDGDDYMDDYDDDDPDQVDYQTSRRLDRVSLSTTPGRRPVPSKGRRSSGARGGSTPAGGGMASRGSSGSLSAGRRQ